MSFILNTQKGEDTNVFLPKSTSQALVKNQVLVWSSGLVVPATSAATTAVIAGVNIQPITAGEALAQTTAKETYQNYEFVADTTNNSNVAHNGQLMVLTDSLTVNNTGTTAAAGVVEQIGVVGAASDKKILVKFVKPV